MRATPVVVQAAEAALRSVLEPALQWTAMNRQYETLSIASQAGLRLELADIGCMTA